MKRTDRQTVFIVDDDAAVRDSIVELLESVGLQAETYDSAPAFLKSIDKKRRGCLVLDVRMAEMSGLVLQQKLNTLGIRIPVILLTAHGDVAMAVNAMKAGAIDFLQKPYREQALLDSINMALSRDSDMRQDAAVTESFDHSLSTLTEREREVFDHLILGKTTKEIATLLQISPRTEETHRRNLLRKLRVGSVKELMGLKNGIEKGN